MKHRRLALCGVLVLLTGCGSAWVKPGASRQDFYADQSACVLEAERPGGSVFINPFTGTPGQEGRTDTHIFNTCMVDHGWSKSDG